MNSINWPGLSHSVLINMFDTPAATSCILHNHMGGAGIWIRT